MGAASDEFLRVNLCECTRVAIGPGAVRGVLATPPPRTDAARGAALVVAARAPRPASRVARIADGGAIETWDMRTRVMARGAGICPHRRRFAARR